MRKNIKRIFAALILIIILGLAVIFAYPYMERGYQADADKKRIADTHKIAELLEEYRIKTGHFPYYDTTPPEPGYTKVLVMATIAMPSAERELQQKPNPFGMSVGRIYAEQLIQGLEEGLDKKIELPVDPQKVSTNAPNAYYAFFFPDDDAYLVLSFLYTPNQHTAALANHANVYAIASSPEVMKKKFFASMGLKPHIYYEIESTELDKILEAGKKVDAKLIHSTTINVSAK